MDHMIWGFGKGLLEIKVNDGIFRAQYLPVYY